MRIFTLYRPAVSVIFSMQNTRFGKHKNHVSIESVHNPLGNKRNPSRKICEVFFEISFIRVGTRRKGSLIAKCIHDILDICLQQFSISNFYLTHIPKTNEIIFALKSPFIKSWSSKTSFVSFSCNNECLKIRPMFNELLHTTSQISKMIFIP